MSKDGKKLLNENTIRRFMKLAEIDTLSDQFVGTLSEMYDTPTVEVEEPVVEEEMGYARDDDPQFDMQDAAAEEMGAEEADMPEDPPEDLEVADVGEEGAEVNITDEEAAALTSVLEKLLGAQGEAPAEDDLDMASVEEPEDEAPEAMMEEDEDAAPGVELDEDVDEDAMVAEITRRVTDRLMKESRNEDMAEQLAEKILARLKGTTQK